MSSCSHSHDDNIAGASHGSCKSYVWGFILSIILTVIPFGVVMQGTASASTMLWTIIITAVIQIFVHLGCFLHMNTSSENGWNNIAFIFTLIVVAILLVGSVWIMINLNTNMLM